MAIVSDSNVLSSLAAADALSLLFEFFPKEELFIPDAVRHELMAGLRYGATYLQRIFALLDTEKIRVLSLSSSERLLTEALPRKLHAGEREGIILCQQRGHLFFSNDKRAIRYCQSNGIDTTNLEAFLRATWTRQIRTQAQVKELMRVMQEIEKMTFTPQQVDRIFAPRQ